VLAAELTFAPRGACSWLGQHPSDSEGSAVDVGHMSSKGALEREPPFQLQVRAESHSGGHGREASLSATFEGMRSLGGTPSQHHGSRYEHSPAAPPSESAAQAARSPPESSRASSARSASLYPTAGSSWAGNMDCADSHGNHTPELSTRSPSRTGEESSMQLVAQCCDVQFTSPMSASDVSACGADTASVTATPVDLAADVDSILCTSFWRS
jgi:hypothetical protein